MQVPLLFVRQVQKEVIRRTTSFIYAAEFKVNPITHIVIAGILRNGLINVGIPKYKRNSCGINGVPLKNDT